MAGTVTWTNANGGSWQTNLNWSTGNPPTSSDIAALNNVTSGIRIVTNEAGTTINQLTMVQTSANATNQLLLNAGLTINSATPFAFTLSAPASNANLVVNLNGQTITGTLNGQKNWNLVGTWNMTNSGSGLSSTAGGDSFYVYGVLNLGAGATIYGTPNGTQGTYPVFQNYGTVQATGAGVSEIGKVSSTVSANYNNGSGTATGATLIVGTGSDTADLRLRNGNVFLFNYATNTITINNGATLELYTEDGSFGAHATQIENWGQFNLAGNLVFRPNQWDNTFSSDINDIHNFGTFTVSGNSASIVRQMAYSAAATNFFFANDPGALFTGTGILTYTNTTTQAALKFLRLNNAGTVAPTTGGSLTLSNVALYNTGTLLADGSTLTISGIQVTNVGGTIVVANGGGWFAPGLASAGGSVIITGGPSASTFSNTGAVIIGTGISDPGSGTLIISNANAWSAGLTIGSGSSNNTVSVYTNTMWNMLAGSITVGSSAATGDVLAINGGIVTNAGTVVIGNGLTSFGNTLSVSNGGKLYSGNVTLGNGAGASNNYYNVGGLGATLSTVSNGAITVGANGAGFNTLTVTNAQLWSGALTVGTNSANNSVLVLGGAANTLWNLGGQALNLGYGTATGNLLRVDGAGAAGSAVITNLGLGVMGGVGNQLILTNGGQLFSTPNNYMIINGVSNNSIIVVGGPATSLWNAAGNAAMIGYSGSGVNGFSLLQIGAGGVVTNLGGQYSSVNYDLSLGFAVQGTSVSNRLVVTDGGQLFASANIHIGYAYTGFANGIANSNAMLIANGGLVRVSGGMFVGNDLGGSSAGTASFNSLAITNGGQLFTTLDSFIGRAGSAGSADNSNTVTLMGGSALWDLGGKALTIGYVGTGTSSANGNVLWVDGAGVAGGAVLTNVGLLATAAGLTLGSGGSGNSLVLTNGGKIFTMAQFGIAGSSNTLTVVGGAATSTFDGGSRHFNIGGAGSSRTATYNVVTIGSGGVVTNAGGSDGSSDIGLEVGWAQGTAGLSFSNRLVVTDGGKLFASSNIFVGYYYGNISAGGAASSNSMQIANNGMVQVSGGMFVGADATAAGNAGTTSFNSLLITNGGQLSTTMNSFIGRANRAGSMANSNTVTIAGGSSSSLWNLGNGILTVGSGAATGNVLNVNTGGTVLANGLNLSASNTSFGNLVNVTGGSLFVTNAAGTANLIIGQSGAGSVTVTSGTVVANQITLGQNAGSTGTLTINNGGTVIETNTAFGIGSGVGAFGIVNLNSGGTLAISNSLVIGQSGTGTLTINGGILTNVIYGTVNALGSLILGQTSGGTGNFTVASGSFFITNSVAPGGQLIVGQNGSGSLTLTNTGQLMANQLLVTNNTATATNSFFTFAGGTLTTSNAANAVAAKVVIASNSTFNINGTWNMLGGTNTIASVATGGNLGGAVVGSSATVSVANAFLVVGAVYSNQGQTIFMNSGGVFSGNVFNTGTWLIDPSTNTYAGNLDNAGTMLLTNSVNIIGGNFINEVTGVYSMLQTSATYVAGVFSNQAAFSINNGSVLTNGNAFISGGVTVLVSDAGSVWSNLALVIGNTGTLSSVIVSNGARLYSGNVTLGNGAGASNNYYNVGGLGATLSTVSNGAITVGANGAGFNTLTVTNANLWSSGLFIGAGSSNNTVSVYSNVTWNMLGKSLSVGTNAATGNSLTINGGIITNLSGASGAGSSGLEIGYGLGANGNSLILTNGGQIVLNSTIQNLRLGLYSASNQLTVVGGPGGVTSTLNGGNAELTIGQGSGSPGFGSASNNVFTVSTGGIVTNIGGFASASSGGWGTTLGVAANGATSSVNQLVIQAGGQFWANSNMNVGYIVNAANNTSVAASNSVVVNGGNLNIARGLTIGNGNGVANLGVNFNSVTVSNGGNLTVLGLITVGNCAGASFNSLMINGGIITNLSGTGGVGDSDLEIGYTQGANGNSLTLTNGGQIFLNGTVKEVRLGLYSASNQMTVVGGPGGVTSTLNGGNAELTIGQGSGTPGYGSASNNVFTVSTGGIVTNIGGFASSSSGGWGAALGVAVNGATSSVNQLVIQAGGQLWANSNMNVGYIFSSGTGNTSVASSNSVVVNGGSLNIGLGLTIGNGNGVANLGVNFNSVTVSNGGSLTVLGAVKVGSGAGASNNSYNVGGFGTASAVTNGTLTVGVSGGGFNTMTVTNANAWSAGLIVGGNNSSNNTVAIQDAASTWNFGGGAITVGSLNGTGANGATGNQFIAASAGTYGLSNIGGINLYSANISLFLSNRNLASSITALNLGAPGLGGNSLTLSNQAFTASAASTIGNNSSSNSLRVVGPTATWNLGGNVFYVGTGTATGNVATIDGAAVSGVSTVLVGDVGSGNSLIITNGGQLTTTGRNQIGGNVFASVAGGSSNLVLVVGGGAATSVWNVSGASIDIGGNGGTSGGAATGNVLRVDGAGVAGSAVLSNASVIRIGYSRVGGTSIGNSLIVTNGGTLYAGEIDVGLNVSGGTSSSNNFYIIDGGSVGSIVSNGSIIVGDNNSGTASGPVGYNTMSVANAQLLSSNVTIGLISSYNTILVKTNTTWNLLGNAIVIGSGAATGNVMAVNGGTITNAGAVTIGNSTGSIGNSLVISNGGNFFSGSVTFGYQYAAATIASNLYQVGGLGAASYAYNGSIVLGYQNNNDFNTLTVTNATLSSGGVGIGFADQWNAANNNAANVLSGGVWNVRGGGVTIGKGQSTGNVLTVNGGLLTNINTLYISMGMGQGPVSASYNSLVITNGGQVFVVAGNSLIGGANWNNTNNNNRLIVNNGTFNSVGFLQVGAGDQATGGRGDTNSLTVANGGYVSVSNLTVGCFPMVQGWGSASNTVTVAGANAAGSNATINLRGGYLFIGNGDQATNNLVLVGGGGVITNAGAVTIGGTLTSANNSLIITNGGALFSGAVSIGSANLCNNNLYKIDGGSVGSVVSNGAITIGSAGGSYNTMTVTNANLLNSGGLTIGGTGATNNTASVLANATWNLLGGNVTIGTGTNNSLTVATGGVLTNAAAVTLSGVGSVFTLGGTAAVNSINLSTTDSRLNFNGGALLAQATGNLITGLGTAFVQNAGATVDTVGNNATITTPLVDDTGSSGGLTKLGAGALTLTGTNTIGQLAMTASSASTTNQLILSGNSVLTVAGNASAYSPFSFNLSGAAGAANLEMDVYGTQILVTNANGTGVNTMTLNGTVKLGTNGGSAASLTLAGGASPVFTNAGVLNVVAGSTVNLQMKSGGYSGQFNNTGTNVMDNGTLIFNVANNGANPSALTFNNSGLWTLQNGSQFTDAGYLVNVNLNGVNSGTLNVLSGSTLMFNQSLNSSGTLTLGTNAVLGYSGSVPSLYNSGLMTVNGTNATLQGVNNGVDYLINSGTLNIGNGSATASFTMNTLSGAITNTGTMNILSNSTLTLAASGNQGSWFIYNSGVITQNTGAVVFNWDASSQNTSYPRTWQNTGTWVLQNGSSITITSSTIPSYIGWMLGSPIINSGTLMVLSGSTVVIGPNGGFNSSLNNTGFLVFGTNSLVGTTIQGTTPILNNTAGGTVSVIATNAMLGYTDAVAGTVTFNNGAVSDANGAALTIGTTGTSATFVMSGGAGVLNNYAGNSVSGNGLLLFTNRSGTAANNNMNFANAGTLTPLAGSTLTLSNVVINNTGAINANNTTLILGNGTLTDAAGGVAIQNGGLLEANNLIFTGGVLTNQGSILQFSTAAPTITGAGGVINNGTIAYRNVATANIYNSQVSNLVFLGQNTFRLYASSNTTAGQNYTFATTLGATNYARLELINGATAYRGGDLTIGSTGTMLVSNTTATIGGNFTNSGVVTILNSPITFASNFINQGTVQLGSNSTVTGLLTMSNGTLAIVGNWAQTWVSNINLQATGTFDTSGGNLTLAGAVTNSSGLLVKTGLGVLTLAATNTYTGGTVVQNGTLIMGNALAISNGTALTVNNGIFDPNGNARMVSTLNGSGGVISNYGLTVTGGGNFSGVIAGPGGLVSTGPVSSVLILGGNNTYSGDTTISNGALLAANSSALSTGAVTTLAGATLQLSNNITLGNVLTLFGTGVSNTGVLASVSGTNYLTGPVTVGSAVRLTADAGQLTLSNLVNSGGFNLSVGGAGTTIVAQVTGSGSGSLLKDGTGALILNGALGYTGPTTVSNGTLAVNGSLSGASVVNVFSNATLTGSAALGNVTLSGGGTISPGNNGVGTITAAALTLAANSKLAFEFGPGAFDQIIVTNLSGLTINGGVLDLYKANTTTTFDLMGSYPLIEYAGTLDGTVTNQLSVANKTGNRLYGFSLTGGWLTLSITSTGGLGWVGSAINNNWSTPANWSGSQLPVAGDQLIFDGQTGLNNTNDRTAHTQFSGIFFNGTAGAFTLNGNAVDLLSGAVNLSANTQTLNLPLVLAASNLVFDANTASLVVNGAISETNGSFGLAKSGAYTLTLAGANTYTGGTILNAGTLSVGAIADTGASGISTSGVLTFNGGALQFTGAGPGFTTHAITNIGLAVIDVTNSSARLTLGGVISGANGLLKYGAGTLVLAGNNTYVGGTTVSTGTVAISADNNLGAAGGALTLSGGTLEATNNFALDRTRDVTLNSPGGTVNVDNNSTLTMGNTIGGAGALTKSGAGTLVLSNAPNNYLGGTVISGGTLALGADSGASENSAALSSGGVTITGGGQLRLGGGAATTNSLGNNLTLNNGMIYAVDGVQHLTSTLAVNSGGGTLAAQAGTKDLFLDGVVSGSGALTIYDTGTTTGAGRGLVRFANNNNTYNGTVTITNAGNNGVLSVDVPTALQFATVNDLSGYGNSLVFYQAAAGATTATFGALGGTANIILQTWNTTAGGDPVVTGGAVTLTVGGNSNETTYAGALGGSGALVKTGPGIMTLTGANANSGGVTVSNGTLQLSGGNNRLFANGAVTVAGGTLDLGGFTQTNLTAFTIAGVLANGTVVKSGADYLGQSGTVSATLAGSAGLTKTTTGTLTLTGTETYTGATTVSNGTLVLNGALFGAGLVNVRSTATLIGNNATLGNVTVSPGGTLVPVNNGIGTLSMGTLTTAAGSLLPVDFTGTTNDQFLVTANNGLTVAGGVFTLSQSGTTRTFDALGTYNLISYAGAIGGAGVGAFTVTNAVGNRLYTFDTAGNWVTLTIEGKGIGWLGASPFWSDTNNWVGGVLPTNGVAVFDGNTQTATINDLPDHALLAGITFAPTAAAFTLGSLAAGTNMVDLEGAVINRSPNPQTINLPLVFEGIIGAGRTFNASNGALTVNGAISETNFAFSLVKTGTNLLVLAGPNTYSGGTVLNAGTLGIGISSLGSTGALGAGPLFIHAGGLVAANGAQTFNNAVSVVGDFSVGGNQDLTVAGPVDLSNATRIITINNLANTFIAGAVSNGALTKAGNGLLTVTGTLAYNGVTTINGGTLQLGNNSNTGTLNNSATVQDNSVLAFYRSDDLTFGNLISGTGAVAQNGTNGVTLSNGNNNYSGATIINSGVLNVNFLTNGGVASAIGAASSAASNLVLNGGTLQYTGSGATIDRLFTLGDNGGTLSAYGGVLNLINPGALGMTGTMNRTLVLTGTSNGWLAASIGDPAGGQTALLKTGTNLWVLSNTNTYSGLTTISGGTLLLADALAAQNSTVSNLVDGGLTFTNSPNFIVGGLAGSANLGLTNTSGGSITLSVGNNNSNTTYLGVLSGSGALTKLGSGTLTLSTNQAYLGDTTVSAGTLQLGGLADPLSTNGAIRVAGGVLDLGGATQFTTNTVTISSGSLTNGTLTKSGADFAGQGGTVAAVLAGDVGLTKTTSGTLILNGANTYTGATTISNGTLQVNGSVLTTGLVTVASGATLAGNGGTVGNVTVTSGGIVAPGISGVGSLTLASLTVSNGSLFNYDFSGTANDQLFVTATNGLTINGGDFRLYQAGTTATFDKLGTYNLISYAGLIQGSGPNNLTIDPATQTGNRLYTFGTNGGWVTLTIAGQGAAWVGANSALWADPGNWGDGTKVPTNEFAVFTGNSRLDTTNDLANARFAGITFDNGAGSFTLNSALAGANTVTLQGDVVNLSSNPQTINLPLLIAGAQGGTFNASNANIVVAGNLTFDSYGSGLLKTGAQAVELTGDNTYTQSTTIAGGILRVNNGAFSPNSNLIFTNGVLESKGVLTVTRSVGTGAGSIQWSGSGGFSAQGGTLTVNLGGAGGMLIWGANSFVPNGSTLQFSSSQADGTVKFMNALNLNGGVRTIQVDNGTAFVDVDLTGPISGASGSGLIKTGAGTLRLSADSTLSGPVTVNAGTLLLASTLTSAGVFVNSNALVGGTGIFASALTLASGTTLSPGIGGAGLLTVSSLNLSNGFVYDWELGVTATDRVEVTALNGVSYFGSNQWTLQLGAEPGVAGLAQWQGSGVLTDSFVLFQLNGAAPAGLTNALILGGGGWDASQARVSIVGNQVLLSGVMFNQSLTVIPEPNVLLMWFAGGVTLWAARRRRRQNQKQVS